MTLTEVIDADAEASRAKPIVSIVPREDDPRRIRYITVHKDRCRYHEEDEATVTFEVTEKGE